MRDFVEIILLPIGGLLLLGFVIIYGIERFTCDGFERATGVPTQYIALECYAKVNGEWVPQSFVFGKAQELRIKAKP